MVHFGNDWDEILAGEFEQDYYKRIRHFLKQEYAENTIYPPMEYIFNALRLTPYSSVKAVILGQDPYHGPGQAHGLCFSVQPGVKLPPSLQNIFKELKSDLGIEPPKDGTLKKEQRGSLYTITARGERDELMAKINKMNPTFCELLPLTLEEIFINETEVAGYDVKKLLF